MISLHATPFVISLTHLQIECALPPLHTPTVCVCFPLVLPYLHNASP